MLSSSEEAKLQYVASRLGVSRDSLYNLIQFESKWNPKIKNPNSSARGLIQFTDSTAVSLGFKNSSDLVKKNPTILDQLSVVERYLTQFKPFNTSQSLYMAVFYPSARNVSPSTVLPQYVQDVNPGIVTVNDYIKHVEGGVKSSIAIVSLPLMALLAYLIFRKGNLR